MPSTNEFEIGRKLKNSTVGILGSEKIVSAKELVKSVFKSGMASSLEEAAELVPTLDGKILKFRPYIRGTHMGRLEIRKTPDNSYRITSSSAYDKDEAFFDAIFNY